MSKLLRAASQRWGVDVPSAIRHFGRKKRIFFAHFRNVKRSIPRFQEVFHDDTEGLADMFRAMKAYYEVGFEGPMRPDDAPMMEGDQRWGSHLGYYVLGKVFALGCMKGRAREHREDLMLELIAEKEQIAKLVGRFLEWLAS